MDRPRNANTHVSETNQRMDYSASTIFFQDRTGSLCKQTFQKSIIIQYNTVLIFWKILVKLVFRVSHFFFFLYHNKQHVLAIQNLLI